MEPSLIEPSDAYPAQRQPEQLPRCCPSHPDWPTLSQHLVADFPEVPIAEIVREVGLAKEAVTSAALRGADGLRTGELIARHRLMVLAGRSADVARLDPMSRERHTAPPSP